MVSCCLLRVLHTLYQWTHVTLIKDQGQNCTSILHPFCTAIIVGLAMRTVVEWANYSPNKRRIVNPAEA